MTTNDLPTPERVGELIQLYTDRLTAFEKHATARDAELVAKNKPLYLDTIACLSEFRRTMMTEEMAREILGKETKLVWGHNGSSFHSVGAMITDKGVEFYMPFKLTSDQLRAIAYWMERSIPSPP